MILRGQRLLFPFMRSLNTESLLRTVPGGVLQQTYLFLSHPPTTGWGRCLPHSFWLCQAIPPENFEDQIVSLQHPPTLVGAVSHKPPSRPFIPCMALSPTPPLVIVGATAHGAGFSVP